MNSPKRAMVLAAGLGIRMRPTTCHTPKPLIDIAGRSMLERVLDHLATAGVAEAVVNTHWLGEQIEDRLSDRRQPEIIISREPSLLETGGGIANALRHFEDHPFFAVNADIVWLDGALPALHRLAQNWRDEDMDGLLLLHPAVRAVGYRGRGDFLLDPLGRITRPDARCVAPYVFTGVQLLHPRLFTGAPTGAFSLNQLYDRASDSARLFGLVHDGEWYHVGTPDAVATVEAEITEGTGSRARLLF